VSIRAIIEYKKKKKTLEYGIWQITMFTWKPYLMLTWPDAMLIKILGMKNGLRRRTRYMKGKKVHIMSVSYRKMISQAERLERQKKRLLLM
jgi:hypothetical protein